MKEGLESRPDPSERRLVPIPRNEANQYLHDLVYGDVEFGSDAASRRILTQEEGLSALNRFLLRKAEFDSLGIFRLNLDRGRYRRESGQYQIYLGRLEEGKKGPYYLNISPAHYLGYEPEQLFVIPRVAQVGRRPYYWIEFTEEITENAMRPSFLSYRLRPDQPTTKIDSKYWRGLEEQLLVDFIQDENGITFSKLTPFRIRLNPKGHPYSLGAVQDLKLNLTGNSQITGGDELLVTPNTDPQNIYCWIDILKAGEAGNEPVKVSTYRILREEKKIVGLGWKNPETQYIVDYLSGDPKITFDNLRPLRVKLPERLNSGGQERRQSRARRKLGEPSIVPPQEGEITPEQRTEFFFNQDVLVLTEAMKGRLIVSQEDGRMIRVDDPEGWTKDRVGNRYTTSSKDLRLTELTPGTLGVFPFRVRRMRQVLISARNEGELGACVRLVRASRYDRDTNVFVPMLREGDIANYFEFEDNQAVRLRFLDDSEILYFNKGEDNGVRVKAPEPILQQAGVEVANKYLRDLVGS
ncbi:hypothetical protein M1437_01905 [Patescibacteria group bacterium]|nr:hypothetical protein [Patescibacteria group bacterium]